MVKNSLYRFFAWWDATLLRRRIGLALTVTIISTFVKIFFALVFHWKGA